MKWIRLQREHIFLILILLLAGFLSFYGIWNEGYGNEFYAACVKSMLQSFHNFFFASFDPGGFVTVDKPPVALWIQTLFAKIFGFYGWSIILPEVIAAVVSVAVLYHLVRRSFGAAAGLLSALVLALSPIFIAVSKTNNIDSILVLTVLLAAWPLIIAAEKGKLRYLLLSFAVIGIGFNIKTLEAYLVLPAFFAVYFFATKISWKKRIVHLAAATALMLAVSLSWSLIVDLTPVNKRPYVDNSTNNSEIELALGYNGIQRLTGKMFGGRDGKAPKSGKISDGGTENTGRMKPPQGGGMPGSWNAGRVRPSENGRIPGSNHGSAGGMATSEGGSKGVLRMFNQQMAGQESWLLPFAYFGIFIIILKLCRPSDVDRKRHAKLLSALLLWGGWTVTMVAYFNVAGFFHRYYLAMLSPGIAAMCGIGFQELWKSYRERGWKWILLPSAIIVTAIVQCIILIRYPAYTKVLVPVIGVAALAAVAVLTAQRLLNKQNEKTVIMFAAVGMAALLIAPAVWSYTPILYGLNTSTPSAGPELYEGGMAGKPVHRNSGTQWPNNSGMLASSSDKRKTGRKNSNVGKSRSNKKLISFLVKNHTTEKYLIAVPDSSSAEPIILATGKPVMSVGGFLGNDNILTVSSLSQMVKEGELRYYLVESRGKGGSSQSAVTKWVISHGKKVSDSLWNGTASSSDSFKSPEGMSSGTLYDLSSAK